MEKTVGVLIILALTFGGCVATRTHAVGADDHELSEVLGMIDDNEVSIFMRDGLVYHDVRIQILTVNSTQFRTDTGLVVISTKEISRIEDYASRAGVVFGIVGGSALGAYVSIRTVIEAHGEEPPPPATLLVGVPVGIIVGVVISRVTTMDDVYALEDPR